MAKIVKNALVGKPRKPSRDFPLFPHATGRWAKKVLGQLRYFGKTSDDLKGERALALWLDQKDDLLAGRKPRSANEGLSLADLCNVYLWVKEHQVDTREITRRHFDDLHVACELLIGHFGKRRLATDLSPNDFADFKAALAKTRGAWALGGVIQKIRSLFKYGYDAGLLTHPVRFGPAFKQPGKAAIRRERAEKPPKMFEAKELREIIDAANQPIKAMLLLAINCGFGNADCGYLQFRHVDLQAGWIDFPRNKTGVERRCPLWPETINALKEAIACRPRDESDETKQLVFLTKYRQPWSQDRMSSPLSAEFKKLTQGLKLYRKGVGYYAIRHTFATIGGETCDQVAVNGIMGHADQHISAHYRERIEANRLIAVSNYVRAWLLPKQPSNETITSIS